MAAEYVFVLLLKRRQRVRGKNNYVDVQKALLKYVVRFRGKFSNKYKPQCTSWQMQEKNHHEPNRNSANVKFLQINNNDKSEIN